jgi:hypothetical protein
MSLYKELKKQLVPRKLWVLRLYCTLLSFIAEVLLALYVGFSLYSLFVSKEFLGNFILGIAGVYCNTPLNLDQRFS